MNDPPPNMRDPTDDAPDVKLGGTIGDRYALEARIGSGRFGPIYRAVDTTAAARGEPNSGVAVQLLWGELHKHERLIAIFASEFRRLRAWTHPNIVRTFDFGRDGETYFWVTELLDGASLRFVLDDAAPNSLEREEAKAVIAGVGNALEYAHARDKAHGDIRPETVLITRDFRVKVLDFAPLAIPCSVPLSAEDLYSWAEAPSNVRDDVYGLACLAYELYSGFHPYGGSPPQEAHRAGLKPERIASLPRKRWLALQRGLATAPGKRQAGVDKLLHQLGVTRSANVPHGPRRPLHARAFRPARRPARRRIALVLGVIGVLGAGFGAYLWRDDPAAVSDSWRAIERRLEAALPSAPELPGTVETAPETHPSQEEPAADAPGETGRADPLETAPPVADPLATADDASRESRAAQSAPLSSGNTAPAASGRSNGTAESETPAPTDVPPVEPAPPNGDRPASTEPSDTPTSSETNGSAASTEPPADDQESTRSPAATDTSDTIAAAEEGESAGTNTAGGPAEPSSFEFAQASITVNERDGVATVTIRRLGSSSEEQTVSWWTTDGTALAEDDYVGFGAQVERFAAGETSRALHIPIVMDSLGEQQETFNVELAYEPPNGGASRSTDSLQVVVIDDDLP